MRLAKQPDRRARLDRLQLLRVTDQDHLRAGVSGFAQHPLELARADHAGLVDDQHVTRCQAIAVPRPAMFDAGARARGDARPAFAILGAYPCARRAAHGVTRGTPGLACDDEHFPLAGAGKTSAHTPPQPAPDTFEFIPLHAAE